MNISLFKTFFQEYMNILVFYEKRIINIITINPGFVLLSCSSFFCPALPLFLVGKCNSYSTTFSLLISHEDSFVLLVELFLPLMKCKFALPKSLSCCHEKKYKISMTHGTIYLA